MTVVMILSLVATVATGVGASKGAESMAKYHKIAVAVFLCCVVVHVVTKVIAKVM